MNQNALAVSNQTNKANDMMNFVIRCFNDSGIAMPIISRVKTVLAMMHDWCTSGIGMSYLYDLHGIDILPLNNYVVNTEINACGCDMGECDAQGFGYYLYEKKRENEYEERLNHFGQLSQWEASSLARWFDNSMVYRDKDHVPEMDSQQLELICWAYLTFCISPEGEEFFWELDPWGLDMRGMLETYSLDKTSKPWRWILKNDRTSLDGGAAVMMCIPEVYQCSYEEFHGYPEDDQFESPEYKQDYIRKCETDMDLLTPDEISITGRDPSECRYCGRILQCVDSRVNYTLQLDSMYEIMTEHKMCAKCKEEKIADGMKFDDECKEKCYTHRCPHVFMREIVDTNMNVEHAAEVVKNGVLGHFWSAGEIPIPNDHFLDERIERLKKDEPNRLRHMAAYVLMRNDCISGQYANDKDCKKINYQALSRWFLTLKQEDYEERMRLGTYEHKASLGL